MIAISGLSADYGGVRALDAIDLAAATGELLGVVGPNGAGKTTLFDVICGVVAPSAGTITVDGARIDRLPPHRIAAHGIARTHQAPRLFPRMTAIENVVAGAYRQRGSRASMESVARDALESIGFAGALDAPARDLTEQARRRVEIARALVGAATVVLLDEAFTSLEPGERALLRTQLSAIARERKVSVLVAERDVAQCVGLCDRAVVLHAGKKIAEGPLDAISADPDVRDAYLGVEWRQ